LWGEEEGNFSFVYFLYRGDDGGKQRKSGINLPLLITHIQKNIARRVVISKHLLCLELQKASGSQSVKGLAFRSRNRATRALDSYAPVRISDTLIQSSKRQCVWRCHPARRYLIPKRVDICTEIVVPPIEGYKNPFR